MLGRIKLFVILILNCLKTWQSITCYCDVLLSRIKSSILNAKKLVSLKEKTNYWGLYPPLPSIQSQCSGSGGGVCGIISMYVSNTSIALLRILLFPLCLQKNYSVKIQLASWWRGRFKWMQIYVGISYHSLLNVGRSNTKMWYAL